MVGIRRATSVDAPALARLRFAFRASIGQPSEDEDAFVERCAPWMAERLRDDALWRCWVAEDDGAIVGHLWLYLLEKIPNPVPEKEWHAYITNVYVDPAHRGGVGGALLETAMAFARELGADSAFLWPTEDSRTLYRRFGFEETADIMEARVSPGRAFGPSAT